MIILFFRYIYYININQIKCTIMKKVFYFQTITLCSVLVSCSNDSDVVSEDLSQDQTCDFYSFEDFFRQDSEDFLGWKSSSQDSSFVPMTRSSVNTFTLNGYSSKVGGGNQKVFIDNTLANLMGIPRQIYVMENVTLYQDIRIEGLGSTSFFNMVESPLCGVDPNGLYYKRGYSSSTPDSNGNIRLVTKCIHIISDIAGLNYNMWYPCKPEEVQWKYNVINL